MNRAPENTVQGNSCWITLHILYRVPRLETELFLFSVLKVFVAGKAMRECAVGRDFYLRLMPIDGDCNWYLDVSCYFLLFGQGVLSIYFNCLKI